MQVQATPLPGCFELAVPVRHDKRGHFVKVVHEQTYRDHGLTCHFAEQYYSVSHEGVLRGLHFQLPPHEHTKVVYCASGKVLDVMLDVRRDSPTYGRHAMYELSAAAGNILYMPPGIAHGFCVTQGTALMVYMVTSAYSAEHDSGIRWNSAGIPWQIADPIISDRDQALPELEKFESPFHFNPAGTS